MCPWSLDYWRVFRQFGFVIGIKIPFQSSNDQKVCHRQCIWKAFQYQTCFSYFFSLWWYGKMKKLFGQGFTITVMQHNVCQLRNLFKALTSLIKKSAQYELWTRKFQVSKKIRFWLYPSLQRTTRCNDVFIMGFRDIFELQFDGLVLYDHGNRSISVNQLGCTTLEY